MTIADLNKLHRAFWNKHSADERNEPNDAKLTADSRTRAAVIRLPRYVGIFRHCGESAVRIDN